MKKLEFDITCPNCKKTMRQRVEDARPGRSRKCPSCACHITFTGDDGRKAQKALDDLEKSLKKLGGTLKF